MWCLCPSDRSQVLGLSPGSFIAVCMLSRGNAEMHVKCFCIHESNGMCNDNPNPCVFHHHTTETTFIVYQHLNKYTVYAWCPINTVWKWSRTHVEQSMLNYNYLCKPTGWHCIPAAFKGGAMHVDPKFQEISGSAIFRCSQPNYVSSTPPTTTSKLEYKLLTIILGSWAFGWNFRMNLKWSIIFAGELLLTLSKL